MLDNLSTGRRENLDGALANGAELVELDIRDADAVARRSSSATQPEVIFHLAAQIDVRKSVADPAADARVNVEGTINVLERRAGARRAAAWSTPRPAARSTARARSIPAPEDHPVAPEAPLRPVEVLRRELLRAVHAACTACRPSRCATATSTGRARTRSARPA